MHCKCEVAHPSYVKISSPCEARLWPRRNWKWKLLTHKRKEKQKYFSKTYLKAHDPIQAMTVKGQPWPSDLDNYDDDDENTDYEEFDMLQTCWIMISVLRPWSG